jgi:outer membrane biosynthesis protein TonB
MADVFISYKREDRPHAERLSIVLEQLGFEVWWDFDLLSGDRYRSVIRAVIDECQVAVVLWSQLAVQSDFVMDEAEYAKAQGKLCPARLDDVALPFGFGSLHTDDLSAWDTELFHPEFQNLVRAIEQRVGRKGRLGGAPRTREAQAASAEMEAFKAAQLAGNAAALQTFLDFHPRGVFAGFVRGQVERMRVDAVAAAAATATSEAPARARTRRPRPPTPPPVEPATVAAAASAPEPAPAAAPEPAPAAAPEPGPFAQPAAARAVERKPMARLPIVVIGILAIAVVGLLIAYLAKGVGTPAPEAAAPAAPEAAAPAAPAAPAVAAASPAQPLVGQWAPKGLSCDVSDMITIAVSDNVLSWSSPGVTKSGTVEGVDPDGAVRVQASEGTFAFRLDGQALTLVSPGGESTPMSKC